MIVQKYNPLERKMERPSFAYVTSQSVDYLDKIHNWSDIDIISSYKEIRKQLDICKEKLREEREQKKLRKSSFHPKQLSQKTAQQLRQSQRGGNNVITIENINQHLDTQKEESALNAEEKNLIRIKNALWRRMGSSVCVGKVVSPRSLEW